MTRPATARAAVFERPHAALALRAWPLRPPGPGEILVRVAMATVCRSDLHSWEGKRHNPTPGILGHEILGAVAEIGDGVGADLRGVPLRPGDRITWTICASCGACYYCSVADLPQKCTRVRKYGHESLETPPHLFGGFAEYCYIVPGTGVLRVPDELTDEEATPLNCGVATMVAATEAAEITVGDAVVVQGLGLLGLYGIALARARGARTIVGLDSVPERLAMAKTFGADHAVDIGRLAGKDVVDAVRAWCPPDGADAVIEVCGLPEVLTQGLQMLRKGGRYTVAGIVFPSADVTLDANLIVSRCVTVRGVHNYRPRHLVQALDFVIASRDAVPLGDLVDARFRLEDADRAFRQAAERRVLRPAVVP